jgi:hypothetical protein
MDETQLTPEQLEYAADIPLPETQVGRAANILGTAQRSLTSSIVSPLAGIARFTGMKTSPKLTEILRDQQQPGGRMPINPEMAQDFSTGLARAAGAAPASIALATGGLVPLIGAGALGGYETHGQQIEDYERRRQAGELEPGEEPPSGWAEVAKGAASNAAFLAGGMGAGRLAAPILSRLSGTPARVLAGYGATVGGNLAGAAAARKIETGKFGYENPAAAAEDLFTAGVTFGPIPTKHLLEAPASKYKSPEARALERQAREAERAAAQEEADRAARAAEARDRAASTSVTSQNPNLTLSTMAQNTSQVEQMVSHIIPGTLEGTTVPQEWPYVGTSTPGERHIVNLAGQNIASMMLAEGDIASFSMPTELGTSKMDQQAAARQHALYRIRQTLDTLRNGGDEGNQIAEQAGLSRTHAIAAFAEAERIFNANEPVNPNMTVEQQIATRKGASVLGNLNTLRKQEPTPIVEAEIRAELNKPEVQAELAKSGAPVPPTDFERLQPKYAQEWKALLEARDKEIEDAHWDAQSALAARFMAEKMAGPGPTPEQQQQIWAARQEALRADAAEKLKAKLAQEEIDAKAAADKEAADLAAAHEEAVPAPAAPALVDKLTGKPVARMSRLTQATEPPPTTPTNETGQNIQQIPNPQGQPPIGNADNAPTGVRGVSLLGTGAEEKPLQQPGGNAPVGEADNAGAGVRGQGQLGQGTAQRPVLTAEEQGWVKNLQELIDRLGRKPKAKQTKKDKADIRNAFDRLKQIDEEAAARQGGGEPPPTPESDATLREQQKQLVDGTRDVMLFTPGETELPVPPGKTRVPVTGVGVFHYDMGKVSQGQIFEAVMSGKVGELLNLGKETKAEAVAAPGKSVVLTEHTPEGVEVRASVTSEGELEAKRAEFEKTKTPGNIIGTRTADEVIAARKGATELDTTSPVTGEEYIGGLARPGQRGVALGAVGNRVRIKWEDGKVTDEEYYKVMAKKRPESAHDLMDKIVRPALKKGKPILSSVVDAIQPRRVKGVVENVPAAWVRRLLEIEGYREQGGQWVKVGEREGPPEKGPKVSERQAVDYHNRTNKMSAEELEKELANPPTDRQRWMTLQIAKLYSDLRAHHREVLEMEKSVDYPAKLAKMTDAELKTEQNRMDRTGEQRALIARESMGRSQARAQPKPAAAAAVPTAEGARIVKMPDGRELEVKGSGHTLTWRDPSFTTGPYGDRFVLASPGYREQILAAEGKPTGPAKAMPERMKASHAPPPEPGEPDVVIIGCGKTKCTLARGEATEAGNLYTGPLFTDRRDFAQAGKRPWAILSALHGLLAPGKKIETYDKTIDSLTPGERREWHEQVRRWVGDYFNDNTQGKTMEVHAGAEYIKEMNKALEGMGVTITTPMKGKGLGDQRAYYKAQAQAAEAKPAAGAPAATGDVKQQVRAEMETALGHIEKGDLEAAKESIDRLEEMRGAIEKAKINRKVLDDAIDKVNKAYNEAAIPTEGVVGPQGLNSVGLPPIEMIGRNLRKRYDADVAKGSKLAFDEWLSDRLEGNDKILDTMDPQSPLYKAMEAENDAIVNEINKPHNKSGKLGFPPTPATRPAEREEQRARSEPPEAPEKIVDAKLQKGNVTPLIEVQVGEMPDGEWKSTFQLNTHESGYGVPWSEGFGSREDAVQHAASEMLDWVKHMEGRKDLTKAGKKQLADMRAQVERMLKKEGVEMAEVEEAPAAKPAAVAAASVPVEDRMTQIQINRLQETLDTGKRANGKKIDARDRADIQKEIDGLKTRLEEKRAERERNPDTPVEAIGEIKEGVADKPKAFTAEVKKILTATLEEELKTAPEKERPPSRASYQPGFKPPAEPVTPAAKPEVISIHIPGDGEFRITKTKEAIEQVLKGIRSMPGAESTAPTGPRPVPKVELTGEEKPRLMTAEELAAEKAAPPAAAEKPAAPTEGGNKFYETERAADIAELNKINAELEGHFAKPPGSPPGPREEWDHVQALLRRKRDLEHKHQLGDGYDLIDNLFSKAQQDLGLPPRARMSQVSKANQAKITAKAREAVAADPRLARRFAEVDGVLFDKVTGQPLLDPAARRKIEDATGEELILPNARKRADATNPRQEPTPEVHEAKAEDLETQIGQLDQQINADQQKVTSPRFSAEKLAAQDRLMKNRALREELSDQRLNMKPEPPPSEPLTQAEQRAAGEKVSNEQKLAEVVTDRKAAEAEVAGYGDPSKLKGLQKQLYDDAKDDLNKLKSQEAWLRKRVEGGPEVTTEASAPGGNGVARFARLFGVDEATLQKAHDFVHNELVKPLQDAATRVFGSEVKVEVRDTKTGVPSVVIFDDNTIGIFVPPQWAAEQRAMLGSEAKFRAYAKKAFGEELQHVATLKVLRDMWNKLPEAGKTNFDEFAHSRFQDMAFEIQNHVNELRTNGRHAEAEAIENAIRASREAYDAQQGSMSGGQLLDEMVNDPRSAFKYGIELARQLNQLHNKKQISESFFERVVQPLNDFYKQVVAHLKGLLGKAQSGEISQTLKELLDGMQSALEGKSAEAQVERGPAVQTQPHINRLEETAIPWHGNDREDIDARTALRSASPDAPRSAAENVLAGKAAANAKLPLGSEARNIAELQQLAGAQPERLIDRDKLVGDGGFSVTQGEHTSVFDLDPDRVVKLVNEGNSGGTPRILEGFPTPIVGTTIASHAASPSEYLGERMRLNNEAFGDDQRYHGVWLKPNGEVGGLVISQPFIEGKPPTAEQVSDFMRANQFVQVDLDMWFRPTDNLLVSDTHTGNFLEKDGKVVPVDLQVKRANAEERAEAMRALGTMPGPQVTTEASAPSLRGVVDVAKKYVKESKAREYGYGLSKSYSEFRDRMSTALNAIESISNNNGTRLANSMYDYYSDLTGKGREKTRLEWKDLLTREGWKHAHRLGLGLPSKELVEASERAFPWREAGFGTVTDVNSPAEYQAKVAAARAELDDWVRRIDLGLKSSNPDVVDAAKALEPTYKAAQALIQTDAGLKQAIAQTARIQQETGRQIQMAKQRDIDLNEVENYIRRLYEDPAGEKAQRYVPSSSSRGGAVVNDKGFAKSRAFKSAVEAMEHGLKIASMDTAKLVGHGEASLQKMIGSKMMERQLHAEPAPFTGRPVMTEKPEYYKAATGKMEKRAPAGYEVVDMGGKPVYVEENVAGLFRMFNEPSDVRRGLTGRTLLSAANNFKAFTLIIDTYHSMRLAATLGGVLLQGKGIHKIPIGGQLNRMKRFIARGQAALDYEPGELLDMVKRGQITADDAQWAKEAQKYYEIGSKAGVAWGRQIDNLYEQIGRPFLVKILGKKVGHGLETFNEFVFKKQTRAAMMVGFRTILDRNIERLQGSKMSMSDIERLSAKETNEIFGNLAHQSWIKGKTGQDIARLFMLAPNWNEGRARFQGRGLIQAGKFLAKPFRRVSYVDENGNVTSKLKFQQPGNAAGTMLALAAGMFAGNQVINGLTRGKPTWENEDGHKMDAFIPNLPGIGGGGTNGFFFSPFNLGSEDLHTMQKYGSRSSILETGSRIAMNKASGLVRGTAALAGIDPMGRPLSGDTNRLAQAVRGYAPVPIPAGIIPGAPWALEKIGLLNPEFRGKGDVQRQLFGMLGVKLDKAETPEQRIRAVAAKTFPQQFPKSTSPGDFARLRNFVSNERLDKAADEIIRLISQGKTEQDVLRSFSPTRIIGQSRAQEQLLMQTPAARILRPEVNAVRTTDYNNLQRAIETARRSPKYREALASGQAARLPVQ